MQYLKFKNDLRSTEQVEYFIHKKTGKKYPTNNQTKEIYVEGSGSIKIPNKRLLAKPLPDNYNYNDIIEAHKLYDTDVLYKLLNKNYNNSVRGYNNELGNVLQYGESYDKYIKFVRILDENCINILKNKYKIDYNTIPAYENNFIGDKSRADNSKHFFAANISLGFFGATSAPSYKKEAHEINLDVLINELIDLLDNKVPTELFNIDLSNMNVSDKIKLIYGEKIANDANILNNWKFIETDYFIKNYWKF